MNNSQIIAIFITTIISLVGAIVVLYFRGEKNHRKNSELMSQNLLNMTNAMNSNTNAINNQTETNKELKQLVHTVNNNILEIKFKNGKK